MFFSNTVLRLGNLDNEPENDTRVEVCAVKDVKDYAGNEKARQEIQLYVDTHKLRI